jgi:hypothetical protein
LAKKKECIFPGDRLDGSQNAYHNQGENSSNSTSGFFGDRFGFQQRPTYGFRNPNYARQNPNNGPSYGWNVN